MACDDAVAHHETVALSAGSPASFVVEIPAGVAASVLRFHYRLNGGAAQKIERAQPGMTGAQVFTLPAALLDEGTVIDYSFEGAITAVAGSPCFGIPAFVLPHANAFRSAAATDTSSWLHIRTRHEALFALASQPQHSDTDQAEICSRYFAAPTPCDLMSGGFAHDGAADDPAAVSVIEIPFKPPVAGQLAVQDVCTIDADFLGRKAPAENWVEERILSPQVQKSGRGLAEVHWDGSTYDAVSPPQSQPELPTVGMWGAVETAALSGVSARRRAEAGFKLAFVPEAGASGTGFRGSVYIDFIATGFRGGVAGAVLPFNSARAHPKVTFDSYFRSEEGSVPDTRQASRDFEYAEATGPISTDTVGANGEYYVARDLVDKYRTLARGNQFFTDYVEYRVGATMDIALDASASDASANAQTDYYDESYQNRPLGYPNSYLQVTAIRFYSEDGTTFDEC